MLLYATSALNVLGGLGALLPALTRVLPKWTVLAADGCAALQLSVIGFHLLKGVARRPFNAVLLALAVLVFWDRGWKAPVAPRT